MNTNKIKVYIYTKFSLPVWPIQTSYSNIHQYRAALVNKTYDEYLEYLYGSERLDQKLYFFENLTLPSIVNQNYTNLEWNIFAHDFLPNNYLSHLYSIVKKYNNINIIKISKNSITHKGLSKIHTPSSENFITSRIDDDDGLYYNYYQLIVDKFYDNYETYGKKQCLLISKKDNPSIELYYEPDTKPYPISCGLSIKNKHIFSVGCSHMEIDKKYTFCDIGEYYSAAMSCGTHTITQRKEQFTTRFDIVSYINGHFK